MSKIWIQKSAEWEKASQMSSSPASPHILIELTCPYCERTNSVAIKRGVSDVEHANIKCAHCQKSWEQVLPGPFMAGPFPK
jgi:transposase-like protein